MILTLLILAGCVAHINLVNGPAHHESLVAQLALKHPTGIWEAIGSIFVGDSDFFIVPCSCHC